MHPILFTFHWHGAHQVHTYGVMLLAGFLLALGWAMHAARKIPRLGITSDDALDASVWILLSAIVFARIAFVLLSPDWRSFTPMDVIAVWRGGISFDGGLAGGILAVVVFCRVRKIRVLNMLDLMAPPLMLGYAIGRIGCFFNGCCYGAPTNLPWAVRFQDSDHGYTILTPPSHPVQLYSTIMALAIFALLAWWQMRAPTPPGQIAALYLIGEGVERFVMEIFRAGVTSDIVAGTPFTTAQFFCFFLVIVGVTWFALASKKARQPKGAKASTPDTA